MKDYQAVAITTAKPSSCNLYYMALGLAGEAGEVANKIKKIMRDNDYPEREDIKAELGDVLWYVAGMATVLGLKLEDIAAAPELLAALEAAREFIVDGMAMGFVGMPEDETVLEVIEAAISKAKRTNHSEIPNSSK